MDYLRQHRTKLVRRLRRQVFRQIVQARRRRADARQGELVQYDGKYASKMRAKREARALCGVALKKFQNFRTHAPLHFVSLCATAETGQNLHSKF